MSVGRAVCVFPAGARMLTRQAQPPEGVPWLLRAVRARLQAGLEPLPRDRLHLHQPGAHDVPRFRAADGVCLAAGAVAARPLQEGPCPRHCYDLPLALAVWSCHVLRRQVVRGPEIQEQLYQLPIVKELLTSLYECHYAVFFRALGTPAAVRHIAFQAHCAGRLPGGLCSHRSDGGGHVPGQPPAGAAPALLRA
jgi:hypothetical protein